MKKQLYIKPTMEVVIMNDTEPLLAGSIGVADGTLDADDALSPEMDDILLDFE